MYAPHSHNLSQKPRTTPAAAGKRVAPFAAHPLPTTNLVCCPASKDVAGSSSSAKPRRRSVGQHPHGASSRVQATGAVGMEANRLESNSKGPAAISVLQEPMDALVDQELWQVLDLCSDEELEAVYSVLYAPSPFSPVVKSLVAEREPPLVEQRGRVSVMHKIESRFRFLAADQGMMMRGARPSYRDALLAIKDRMDVPCSANLSTFDLETEVFLHVLHNCVEYVQGESDPGDPSQAAAVATMQEGDGMSSSQHSSRRASSNWFERATAPILFGIKEMVPTLVKFGSAVTVTAVGRSTAQQLAVQLVRAHLQYQTAVRACATAARGSLAVLGKQAGLEAATRGLQAATARYSALQGALSFLGPVMWGWLAVDLAYKAIGTDYARIIRAVFILAQVRLLRTHGFTNNPHHTTASSAKEAAGGTAGAWGSSSSSSSSSSRWHNAAQAQQQHSHLIPTPPYGSQPVSGHGGSLHNRPGTAHEGDDDDEPYTHHIDIYN